MGENEEGNGFTFLCPRGVGNVNNGNFMEPASGIYLLDQNPGIRRRNGVCTSHLSCILPLLQPKFSSVNMKKCLCEIGMCTHYRDAAPPNGSCSAGPV